MDSGIYSITNRLTGDRYVGSAKSIKERWARHRKDLSGGRHHSQFLQRSWDKHGEEQFQFTIIEECALGKLCSRENFYLLRLQPTYNACPEAYSQIGRRLTKEHVAKLSRYARENNIRPPASTYINKRRAVSAISIDTGSEIARFESLSSACVWAGRTHRFASTIADCCNGGRHKTFAGYKWNWI